ncbi:MAG TPA: hypothetical protein VHC42_02570 [Rhizomicrobium sp.]|nr:hypothetical protein [Rhizomicrobium sp.]
MGKRADEDRSRLRNPLRRRLLARYRLRTSIGEIEDAGLKFGAQIGRGRG